MEQSRPRNFRRLEPNQRCELRVGAVDGGDHIVIWQSSEHLFEAPNWTPDGAWLLFNQEGDLYRIAPTPGSQPVKIPIEGEYPANNDHVLSPDGATIYISVSDGHLYSVPFVGGRPVRISNVHEERFTYYLHGVSPDNATLAYVAVQRDSQDRVLPINTYTIPTGGGPDVRLTDWRWNDDGPEFTPDGDWILFNSDHGSDTVGHSQVCKMRPNGSEVTHLTSDERVNWFPHPSPDGKHILYLSFPPGTTGHPANKQVALRLMNADGSEGRDVVWFNGGQGTTNVNGWAPDSRRFAYVAYP